MRARRCPEITEKIGSVCYQNTQSSSFARLLVRVSLRASSHPVQSVGMGQKSFVYCLFNHRVEGSNHWPEPCHHLAGTEQRRHACASMLNGSTDRTNVEPDSNKMACKPWLREHKDVLNADTPCDGRCAEIKTQRNEREPGIQAARSKVVICDRNGRNCFSFALAIGVQHGQSGDFSQSVSRQSGRIRNAAIQHLPATVLKGQWVVWALRSGND